MAPVKNTKIIFLNVSHPINRMGEGRRGEAVTASNAVPKLNEEALK
jgi:hypothetical protein